MSDAKKHLSRTGKKVFLRNLVRKRGRQSSGLGCLSAAVTRGHDRLHHYLETQARLKMSNKVCFTLLRLWKQEENFIV